MSAVQLFLEVIREHTPQSKWIGSTLEPFRQVANTNRGDIGEDFLFRYLKQSGIRVARNDSRVAVWDLEIEGRKFELKTASEDMSGAFQFDHVRLDRNYEYISCASGFGRKAWSFESGKRERFPKVRPGP